jgi:Plasmid pRiA4b ORF-3-like protein
MIYKYRVILDDKEDIFRDIAIENDSTFEDLHNAIINAFGFDGTEAGSFFTCEDDWTWNEDDGIPLFDLGDNPGEIKTMAEYQLQDIMHQDNTKMVYVYDLFSMWTFFVELAAIEEKEDGITYPNLLFSHGIMPEEASTSGMREDFNADFGDEEFRDDYDEDDFDNFGDDMDYGDFGGYEDNYN